MLKGAKMSVIFEIRFYVDEFCSCGVKKTLHAISKSSYVLLYICFYSGHFNKIKLEKKNEDRRITRRKKKTLQDLNKQTEK